MNRLHLFSFVAIVALASTPLIAAPPNILFVGNSYTHGQYDPLLHYNDANVYADYGGAPAGEGGIPGVFQKMASNLNYPCTAFIEATSGQNLTYQYTYAGGSNYIAQSKYNVVVLQDYSTEPTLPTGTNASQILGTSPGPNIANFDLGVSELKSIITPTAKIYLYATWARPDSCPPNNAIYVSLNDMFSQLSTNYNNANATYGLNGVAPVGNAFQRAISDGYAHANIYDGPVNVVDWPITTNSLKFNTGTHGDGKFSLWHFYTTSGPEGYHMSIYGGYLAGAVLIERITGLDPRNIPTSGTGNAANDLGILPADAAHLNTVAWEVTSTAPIITNGPPPATATLGTAYNFTYQASALPTATTFSVTSGTLPSGLTLSSAGVLSGTPAAGGTYTGTIQANNGVSPNASQNFRIVIPWTYAQWASYYGITTTGGIQSLITSQQDGIPYLLKYLCDINPTTYISASDSLKLPTVGMTTDGQYITLIYHLSASASGLTIAPQGSTDLTNWNLTPDITQNLGTDSLGDSIVEYEFAVGPPQKFVRLNVNAP